ITFPGKAGEAMAFYRKVVGGTFDSRSASARGAPRPAGPRDSITNARLEADGAVVIGSDGHPSYPPTVGDNMAVDVGGTDRARLTKIFNDLAVGGKIKGPLTEQSGGAAVGWLTDKFGINWTVSIDKV